MSNYSFLQKQKLLQEYQKIPKKNIKRFLEYYGLLIAEAQRYDFLKKYPALPRKK